MYKSEVELRLSLRLFFSCQSFHVMPNVGNFIMHKDYIALAAVVNIASRHTFAPPRPFLSWSFFLPSFQTDLVIFL